ncbi:hypothetical protein OG21DRAFT_1514062, partial [Imleria badia]
MDRLCAGLFARAPVYDLVFGCLSPRSLIRLALTCRASYLAVAEFKTRAFNINRHLSRYFADPIAFRCLQARTNTLVSGSNALQFLDRSFYPEADLDLYTHSGHSFEVAQFIVEAEGYHYAPRETQEEDWRVATHFDGNLTQRRVTLGASLTGHSYPTTDIRDVWTFEKTNIHDECLTVQIIEARSSPLESILGFHSTCVMNFITSDAAYSLYPIATFEDRSALGMPSSRSSERAIQKYVKRGWRVYFLPTPNDFAFFLEQVRWVTDKRTWALPLDQTGVQPRPPLSPTSAALTCDPALFNGWRFRVPKKYEGMDFKAYECHYYPLKTTLFRYNYAIPEERLQLFVRDWALQQGKLCHWQIAKEDWIWFDTDLPAFLKQTK